MDKTHNAPARYRVGFLGIPSSQTQFEMAIQVPWTPQTLSQLEQLGINTIQLNVAWGRRPGDEPLNIEDVVSLSPAQERDYPQVVPLRCRPQPEAREKRRADLRQRIELCRQAGLRTIFHFGAPYNAHARYGDAPPNCLMDEKVLHRYELLLDVFASDFPGVDDILIYTYDQDAWLCSEFGPCPRCLGIPLHNRVVPFLERLAGRWQKHSPAGRLWWEPWELSAGQVLACVERLRTAGFGLALHSNIAEVMAALPVDRWLKNTIALAHQREIPVIVEHWLGGQSEELEPFYHLSHPLVTWRALQAISSQPGVSGIKEYFGLDPRREDANLRMTGLFFADPHRSEEDALRALAEPYGAAADGIIQFWRLCGEGMELFPWDLSWYIREVGRSRTDHSLSAAMLRGQQAHTPSWESTRRAIFMKTENAQPDPWMLEDVQLRCELAADRWAKSLTSGQQLRHLIPPSLRDEFEKNLTDLGGIRRRASAYAMHIRESNLALVLRRSMELGLPWPKQAADELLQVLQQDQENHQQELAAAPSRGLPPWDEIRQAIALLQRNPHEFLQQYFREDADQHSRGGFSVTSR